MADITKYSVHHVLCETWTNRPPTTTTRKPQNH